MTKLKTRLPIKALSVLMAILMIFSTISIMFTVSAAAGGGNGTWGSDTRVAFSGQNAFGYYSNQNVNYAVYLPENYTSYASNEAGNKLAVMLVMSGGSSTLNTSYEQMASCTGLNYLADKEGIILIYFRQSNMTINSGYYWNWFMASDQGRNNANYPLPKIIGVLDSVKSTYSNYIDSDRTYLAGFSAGGAQAQNLAAVYPEKFKGAAIVAGLPFKIATNSTQATSAQSGSRTVASATLGGYITSAWNTAGVTAANAPRVIVFHGESDRTVDIGNSTSVAESNAYALTGKTSYDEQETGTGYTVKYYGKDDSMVAQGYSKARSSDVAFYTFNGIAHTWIAANANMKKSDGTVLGASNANFDYNDIMWEFFEGEIPEPEAPPVVDPATDKTIAPSNGALFCQQNGQNFADLVTSAGLKITAEKLVPTYVTSTNSSTARVWNFNFDIKAQYDATVAANPDKDVKILNIEVYQNAWNTAEGSRTVKLAYKKVDTLAIGQGVNGNMAFDGSTQLGTHLFETFDEYALLDGVISEPAILSELSTGYLSVITHADNDINFNVAAPVIKINFEYTDKADDPDQEVEGDVATERTSGRIFPVFAYNSAAGYNAPTSEANETKTYSGIEGNLVEQSKPYAVGVYNAGEDNDTIYYSFNLADYTKGNGYTITSITIKYILEGNPYFTKQDVGVNMLINGNTYWSTADTHPYNLTTLDTFVISKGEYLEGEITINTDDENFGTIVNNINNLGGMTIAFENTSGNSHYYFLSYVPTITVNYANIPNTPQNPITGIGQRFDTDYKDFVGDQTGGDEDEDDDETEGGSGVESEPKTGDATITSTTIAAAGAYEGTYNARTSTNEDDWAPASGGGPAFVVSFDIYTALQDIESQVRSQIAIDYPGQTISSLKLFPKVKISAYSSSSMMGKISVYYSQDAQSSVLMAYNPATSVLAFEIAQYQANATGTADVTLNNTTFSSTSPYLWVYGHSGYSYNSFLNAPEVSLIGCSYEVTFVVPEEPKDDEEVTPPTVDGNEEATIDPTNGKTETVQDGANVTETNTVSTSSTVTSTDIIGQATNGYLVGTNPSYYSAYSSNYFTGDRSSLGEPQANVVIDTSKLYAVSNSGYAYLTYDLSSFFAEETKENEIKKTSKTEALPNGGSITTITYTKVIVSDIRISGIYAKEGYIGSSGSGKYITGSVVVAGTGKWTGENYPSLSSTQSLGSANVSNSTMVQITPATSLNSTELENARNGGAITIRVQNAGNNWSSDQNSAWLLASVPTVTVTYKTITYTDKEIISKITVGSSQTIPNDLGTNEVNLSVNYAENGYLYANGHDTTSSTYYRTTTATSNSKYKAQGNVNLKTGSDYAGTKFAVTYLGVAYADYNVKSLFDYEMEGYDESRTDTKTENGRTTTKRYYVTRKLSKIEVSTTTQAGWVGTRDDGATTADSKKITNIFYVNGQSGWSGNGYTPYSSGIWQEIATVEEIKTPVRDVTGTINATVLQQARNSNHLTVAVRHSYCDWDSNYHGYDLRDAAWTLITMPTITAYYTENVVEYVTTEVEGSTNEFTPKYEVYAQYRFSSDDANLSKTKLLGTMTGYGASAVITPYTSGTMTGLFSNPVLEGATNNFSVNVTNDETQAQEEGYYILKRAYVEDTGEDITSLVANVDGTYTLNTLHNFANTKTNKTYRIRIIFEYENYTESQTVDTGVKVNLHAVFQQLDSNGNVTDTIGTYTQSAFATLRTSSYFLSLDDIMIPYGDYTVGETNVSAIHGTNSIYDLKVEKTTITLNDANSSAGNKQSTSNANDCEITDANNNAKVYLDLTDGKVAYGDILLVTYNDDEKVYDGGEIDVYLYYEAVREENVTVNYVFDVVDLNGNSLVNGGAQQMHSVTSSYSVGSMIPHYDTFGDAYKTVTLTVNGVPQTFNFSEFETFNTTTTAGVSVNDQLIITEFADGQRVVTVKYKLVVDTSTEVTVTHTYNIVYGGTVVATVTLPNTTTANLTAPSTGSVAVVRDNTTINGGSYGTFTASQFTPVSITRDNAELTFGAYSNGAYAATNVPYDTPSANVTITYELVVNKVTVNESFTQNGVSVGTGISNAYYAPAGTLYTFNSTIPSDYVPNNDGYAITEYTASSSDVTLTNTTGGSVSFQIVSLNADKEVTIEYSYNTSVEATVNHEYFIKVNGEYVSVTPNVTNTPTSSLTLNQNVTEPITTAQGTVTYNGTTFKLSEFTPTVSASSEIDVDGLNVTLKEFVTPTTTITVRYELEAYKVNVTEIFTKDTVEVARATKTVYVKAGEGYTFTSDYANGIIISEVALSDYIRTAEGATVTTAGNGAATFTVDSKADVTINYAVSTKTIAEVEYVYIVNDTEVTANTIIDGAPIMNLVYNSAVSAPSATGTYVLGKDVYSIEDDFTKTVTVSGAATASGNDVTLNAYNVEDRSITVTVTYEITISNEADAIITHTYYINNTQLTGDAIANVTTGTEELKLVYGVSQTIDKSTGTVNYNGTEFDLDQFVVTVESYNDDVLIVNGLDVKLDRHDADTQIVVLRYELKVHTIVVNEEFFINGVKQTGDTVSKTYYVSAKYAALTAGLVSGSKTVNGIAVSNFIVSASDNSDAIDGVITAGDYVATVNGNGTVTITYDVSTKTNVNITSIFKVNGSADGVDISNVTNATATQNDFEYGVSTPVTSLAGGYVIWNGTQFNVSDFTASITDSDATTISASGLNVTVNKYNTDATDIVITYEITVRSITVTENFYVDSDKAIETKVTTKWYPYSTDSTYTFTSNYGNSYVPTGTTIALSNFVPYSDDVAGITKNSDGCVEFTVSAADNATATIDYKVTTKANVTVLHKYYFNGTEIAPEISTQGDGSINLDYGVPAKVTLTEGTHEFNQKLFNLSDAKLTVTSSNPNVIANVVDGEVSLTLNAYNQTATEIWVEYHLSTVVVNITEIVITDNGAHTLTKSENTFYLLDDELLAPFTLTFDTYRVNGVDIPYNLFTRTVTGAEGFNVEQTDSAITISGLTSGQNADIVITYSGVTTTGIVQIYKDYYYRNYEGGSSPIGESSPTYATNVSVGDRIPLDVYRDLTFTANGTTQTINTSYFYMDGIKATGFEGKVENNEFVITGMQPNMAGVTTKIWVKYYVDLYDDVDVVHEFYVNNNLVHSETETVKEVSVVGASYNNATHRFVIKQNTSGTITVDGKKYNVSDFTVNNDLVTATGLTVKRVEVTNYTDRFAVQKFDFPPVDERTVVIRYDLITTLEEADVTVNSHYVNNGEYVGTISNTTVTTLKPGDVIANETVKTINGVEVTFTVQSVVVNGLTITEENGVYKIDEISPKATEWSIDITYVATATASVKLTHKFFVANKEIGTITDNTVIVNLANHSGKFVALNGVVGVTTDNGVVMLDASRFTVTLKEDYTFGAFADGIFTLNADALNGSTYEITFEYRVDGISYALDGETGIKQTATATDVKGQYNVVTTVTSVGNTKPIDIIFVVDISAGAGDTSNAKLTNTKADITEYITNSFAVNNNVNNNVRVAIVTYADGYEILTGGYITDKDTAVAAVEAIELVEIKDGYDETTSNLQAGLYGARMLMNSDVRRAYTDVIVFKGSEPDAAYNKYNSSYNYSVQISATADVANTAANYELDMMKASKEIVIDLTNEETNVDATMTKIFDERNYINVNGEAYITINIDEFTFVKANGVKVNGVDLKDNEYSYRESDGLISIKNLGTLKGDTTIEYTIELKNKVDGDYFVSDEIKVAYNNTVSGVREIVYGVSARVSYSTTVTGATITVIPYLADSNKNPIGMDGLTVKNFYEDAIIGKPVVYTVSGVTNLTAGNTYTVKAPVISGYTLWNNEQSTQTVTIPAEGKNEVVYFAYYADGSIVDDTIVYDQAGVTAFDVLANDTRPDGNGFTAIHGIGATESEAMAGNTERVTATSGSLEMLKDGRVIYISNNVQAVTDEFYYAVKDGNETRVAKIYVVPATIVKVDSSDNTQLDVGDRWQVMDNDGNIVDRETNDYVSNKNPNDTDDIYGGYEDNYSNNFLFDGGDSLYANRYQDYKANGNVDVDDEYYTTSFTFTGTGFDIISVTGRSGGYVKLVTTNEAGKVISKASGNICTFALTDPLYQATIFTCTDLTLDTYTVEVIALRTVIPIIGLTDTQVYIDSVRTYNPFENNTNEHYNDLHDGTVTETLKNIFVDGKLAVSTGKKGLHVFTSSELLDINSYMDSGTNNAISIIKDQSLLFKLDDASVRTKLQVEMAAIDSNATVAVYVNSKLVDTLNIDTGVFAYYDFSSYIRENGSTVKFLVTEGKMTFTKVRYKDAYLSENVKGEKYTTAGLATQDAPDTEKMSDAYTVNTVRLVKYSGTSRKVTALVYTSKNVDSVIAYTSGYRIAPTSVTMNTDGSDNQNWFIVTYTLPDAVPVGSVLIDFYAFSSTEEYSSNYLSATYTLS